MKIPIVVLIGLLMPSTLVAKDISEENFNRLFTTPAERARLDLARTQGKLFKKSVDASDSVSVEGQSNNKPSPLKVSGIILRADGKAQVWVSGQPLYASLKQLNSDKNNSSDLRIPLSGKSISLKPGQVLANGKAKEAYYFVTQSSVASQSAVETPRMSSSSVSSAVPSNTSSSVSSLGNKNDQIKAP